MKRSFLVDHRSLPIQGFPLPFGRARRSRKQLHRYEPGIVFWEPPRRRTFVEDLTLLAVRVGLGLALLAVILYLVLTPGPSLPVGAWMLVKN